MTEEEAKTKWCPMSANSKSYASLAAFTGLLACNKSYPEKIIAEVSDAIPDNAEKCIGSECMMWKEDRSFGKDLGGGKYKYDEGYCGLTK